MKRLAVIVWYIVFMLLVANIAFADARDTGAWMKNSIGWWWQYCDGTYPQNEWVWIDGNNDRIYERYYFDANGYCLIDTITPDGCTVNADGATIEAIRNYIESQGEKD